ncbi:hypothetical protein KUCAC02_022078, partial [Chaenocephalus aceratus]
RASSVNLSLEKLADAQEDSSSNKRLDIRAESLERQSSTESQPPPKPPHTYYDKHRYPEEGEARTGQQEALLLLLLSLCGFSRLSCFLFHNRGRSRPVFPVSLREVLVDLIHRFL